MKQYLLFIASDVSDHQVLLDGLKPGVSDHVLMPDRDSIQQITQIAHLHLSPGYPVAIHIASHGDPGVLYLGNSQLSLETLARYTEESKIWFPIDPLFW